MERGGGREGGGTKADLHCIAQALACGKWGSPAVFSSLFAPLLGGFPAT